MDKKKSASVMYGFESNSSVFTRKSIGILLVVVLLGVGTGYMLAQTRTSDSPGLVGKLVNKASIPAGKTFGDGDPEIFKDTTEGVVKEGGLEGEGQFHLIRPGGESQTVYMTSSTVDLSQFVDRKVKVWGQTQAAQKVGWLMDVGKVEVLE